MKKDKIVEEVKELFDSRSQVGIKKYGKTLEENLTENYLQHAMEESMDHILYLKTISYQLKQFCKDHPNDAELGAAIRNIYGNEN